MFCTLVCGSLKIVNASKIQSHTHFYKQNGLIQTANAMVARVHSLYGCAMIHDISTIEIDLHSECARSFAASLLKQSTSTLNEITSNRIDLYVQWHTQFVVASD